MKTIELKHHTTGDVLFVGQYASFKECVEAAVAEGVVLEGLDAGNQNLVNANLDGAIFRNASFANANLMGANLSEARFDACDFTGATMVGVCACESNFLVCDFTATEFGATDFFDSALEHCTFSSKSCFGLEFRRMRTLQGSTYRDIHGDHFELGAAPIVITGLPYQVVFFKNHIKVGSFVKSKTDWANLDEKTIVQDYGYEGFLFFKALFENTQSQAERITRAA